MSAVGQPPKDNSDLSSQYLTHGKIHAVGEIPSTIKMAKTHRKRGQEAWFSILKLNLDSQRKKQILRILVHEIVPWINNLERLMDFLTDSYNEGGEMSFLALAGLFYLIQEKNLDYPSFYEKLYSLLDDELLHSKHRSRFFRLLDTFMASTHLPAALVASFIKRLSRLTLSSPPAGIVVVVPWVYNMFKRHPACTFMLHREARNEEEQEGWEQYGAKDPFDMEEKNPMETGAIDSCIWELEVLQSHYQPNVATLAKIISEQFTKQQYNLEDFLDYSYNSVSFSPHNMCRVAKIFQLLDSELSKNSKKTPIVEYQVPKAIFRNDNGTEGNLGSLFNEVLSYS
jgi:U3 small nucleolar RNA-associated protein 19